MVIVKQYLTEVVNLFLEACPYMLFGVGIVFFLRMVLHPEFFYKQLGGKGIGPIFKAMFLGLPLPVCSCGVIPLADYLYKNRINRGAIGAFLVATPTNGIDSIFVTYGILGLNFAILRPLAGGIIAIFVGISIYFWGEKDSLPAPTKIAPNLKLPSWTDRWNESVIELQTFFQGTGKRFIIGMLILSPIYFLLPTDVGKISHSGKQFLIYISMILIGMPLYICSTSSVPIALLLLQKGFSTGAAFTFLTAGPLTNLGVIHIMVHILGKSGTILFYSTCSVSILLFAFVLDQMPSDFFFLPNLHKSTLHIHLGHSYKIWIQIFCTSGFFLLFAWSFGIFRKNKSQPNTQSINLSISGMVCTNCELRIQKELKDILNVKSVAASYKKQQIKIVAHTQEALDQSVEKLRNLGYVVKPLNI